MQRKVVGLCLADWGPSRSRLILGVKKKLGLSISVVKELLETGHAGFSMFREQDISVKEFVTAIMENGGTVELHLVSGEFPCEVFLSEEPKRPEELESFSWPNTHAPQLEPPPGFVDIYSLSVVDNDWTTGFQTISLVISTNDSWSWNRFCAAIERAFQHKVTFKQALRGDLVTKYDGLVIFSEEVAGSWKLTIGTANRQQLQVFVQQMWIDEEFVLNRAGGLLEQFVKFISGSD